MTNRRNRSALVWLVIAVAVVAIAWKLVARPSVTTAPVQPTSTASAHEARMPIELDHAEVEHTNAVAPAILPVPTKTATPIVLASGLGTASVYGFVLPAAGESSLPTGTQVWRVDRIGGRHWSEVAADGAYAFGGLQPGRHWLGAGSRIGDSARTAIDLAGDRRLDLQLQPAGSREVRVRVVDAQGKPLEEFPKPLAVATEDPPGRWIDEISGSANNPFGVGQFFYAGSPGGESLPAGFLGRIALDVEPPVHVSLVAYQLVVATQKLERGQSELTFVLQPAAAAPRGKLRFRFIDATTRKPLTKGAVMLGGQSMRTGGLNPDAPTEFELAPGPYVVHLHTKGYGDPEVAVRVEPNVDTDLGEIPVGEGRSIAGRILDERGEPSTLNVSYDACDDDGGVRPLLGGLMSVKPDEKGSFRISGLGSRKYRLRSWGEGLRCSQVVDLRGGSVEDVEIRLARTVPLVVTVTDPDWRRARLRVVDAEGVQRYSEPVRQPEPIPIELVAGHYRLEYRAHSAAEPLVVPVEIRDVPLELALP